MKTSKTSKTIKIAICGTRGIPACYGGFETFAEQLSTRLIEKGYEVVVYGRKHIVDYPERYYNGVEIKLLPAPKHKYLETLVHTLLSLVDLIKNRVDLVLICNAANGPLIWIPRIFGMPVAINLDGIERKRAKWNILGKLWYRFGEITSVLFANRLIADAQVIRDYYQTVYRRNSEIIRYGYRPVGLDLVQKKVIGDFNQIVSEKELKFFSELELVPGQYILYVSRLEPENNALRVIQAYKKLSPAQKKFPLAIVGGAPYAKQYIAELEREAEDENIKFLGWRFHEPYELLQRCAYIYVQATEVGGVHPALVESLGYGNCILANDVPEHREVVAETGLYYSKNDVEDLRGKLEFLLCHPNEVTEFRRQARARAEAEFSWDVVTDGYVKLFKEMLLR